MKGKANIYELHKNGKCVMTGTSKELGNRLGLGPRAVSQAYQEGYNLGLENAQKDLVALKSNIGAFLSAEKKVFEAIAPDIIEISLEIAKKIIKHEVQVDRQIVIDTVMDVLKNIPKNEPKIS